jgi:anti-sigma B factor antagonist
MIADSGQLVHPRILDPILPTRTEHGYVVVALSGALDIACAPALREQFLRLIRAAANRLVIDLSLVSHADASGVAVLVGAKRRARLLGGSLRLAAPSRAMASALRATGLDMQLGIFPTVQAAVSSPVAA